MQLIDLSPNLTVDADKIIGIRATDSYDINLLLFKDGATMTISLDEARVLRTYAKPDATVLTESMKYDLMLFLQSFLDHYFKGYMVRLKKDAPLNNDEGVVDEGADEKSETQSGWKTKFGDDVVAYLMHGHSTKEAAENFGISERTVYRYMKERRIAK